MAEDKTWTCHCGEFKVKLTGEPTLTLCCHCHSCVAPLRFIDDKRKDGNGTSASHGGGMIASYYPTSKVEFPADLDGKLSFVKVGESGRAGRCYTHCCQSQVTNMLAPKMVGLTTNFIKNGDGSTYVVPNGPVWNVNAKNAFDPSAVPDPKHNSAPFGIIASFLKMMLNPFESSLVASRPALFPDRADAETIPITW